ncbi:MAG: TolC family protein [Gemmataceae bacterium]|nr:TolC family protein [Gemmataceae bacterium]
MVSSWPYRLFTAVPLLLVGGMQGCSTIPRAQVPDDERPWATTRLADDGELRTADEPTDHPAGIAAESSLTLAELLRLTVARHPRLAQAELAIEAARGRALQAGLYPNPSIEFRGDELGDRTGTAGILTLPGVTQEIVTANKLGLSRAAALRGVDQATLALVSERYARFTAVRQAYYEYLTVKERLAVLEQLVKVGEMIVAAAVKLREAKQDVTQLDIIQLEIELERFRAERDAARRELPAVQRKLAAAVGLSRLPGGNVVGALEPLPPDYDLEQARRFVIEYHPDVRAAQLGVEQAELILKRAQVEAVPNVTVGAAYIRQYQNKSHDAGVSISLPVPVWNRNQGNVQTAQAQLGEAVQQVRRVEIDLTDRLAAAFAAYAPARQRAERYRTVVVPKAREAFELARKAYQGGQLEYLRVLRAERDLAETTLDYVRSLGEAWRAASEIAGLLLEEDWPATVPTQ